MTERESGLWMGWGEVLELLTGRIQLDFVTFTVTCCQKQLRRRPFCATVR